jgi:2-polyprenyl-6-methoxyphenol hydroxylase-like FAD-dependent oxidoreductase
MQILISGASVAGPVLAYWLKHYGFIPTVVEKSPTLRKTGGHAVDLFRPAMDIVEWMGLTEKLQAKKTGTERLTLFREGTSRVAHVEMSRLITAVSDRHVEIMRDDLTEIFYDATRDEVEYVFGDSITSISDSGEVTFAHGEPRRFDLVIGADGLHSNVRRLVFGAEVGFATFIGAYLSVLSVPNYLRLEGDMITYSAPGRMAGIYSAQHMTDARAVFLFRSRELDYSHRDTPKQKQLLREAYAGMGWEVPRLMAELDRTPAFYFDSITQIQMNTWSRGRVSLVGDAGYCPGPAVGGGTSLAVVGAYVLAGELAAAGGDHVRGFRAYEHELGDYARRSRTFALSVAKRIVPDSRAELWAMVNGTRLLAHIPPRIIRALSQLNRNGIRLHDTMALKDYSKHRASPDQ